MAKQFLLRLDFSLGIANRLRLDERALRRRNLLLQRTLVMRHHRKVGLPPKVLGFRETLLVLHRTGLSLGSASRQFGNTLVGGTLSLRLFFLGFRALCRFSGFGAFGFKGRFWFGSLGDFPTKFLLSNLDFYLIFRAVTTDGKFAFTAHRCAP